MAESIVQKKLAKLIQQEISEILNQQAYISNVLLTVSIVRITGDLSIAKIYVSCFPDAKQQHAIDTLNEHVWEMRKLLAQKIKNKVRKIPDLRFYADDTLQEVEKIEEIFKEINLDDDHASSDSQ